VEGIVTKGGRPLANVQVIFLADVEAGTQGPRASGLTDEAGHYRLRTDAGDDGAAVGTYRVCLHDTHRVALQSFGRLRKEASNAEGIQKKVKEFNKEAGSPSPRVPPNYGRPNDTPLRAEVHPGPQTRDFDVP
jgi:hypothetical protein